MDVPSLSERIKSAELPVLQEVLREAELYLAAQLTSAIAADSRAYTFAGAVAATAVLLVGASYSATVGTHVSGHLAITSFGVASALFVSAWMAVVSARSIRFEFAGNEPCKWISDVEEGRPLVHSIAEQCEHYDTMIAQNSREIERNGRLFNSAVNIALCSIGSGGVSFLAWMAPTLQSQ
jgi:hypothetical protein